MKKILLVLAVLFMGIQLVQAQNFEGLYNNYQAVYLPSTNSWSTGSLADDKVVLTKKTSVGSGSYSEYYYSNGKQAAALSSNFEFIKDGRLITVNNAELKFGELVYRDGKFVEKSLSDADIESMFPGVEIVKISQFTDGKLKIKKGWFDNKTILLVNDTDKNFYKYSFKPSYVKETDITGLITFKRMGKVTFSHYGDDTDKLIMYVLN